MPGYVIAPFDEQNLLDVAAFMRRSIAALQSSDNQTEAQDVRPPDTTGDREAYRWLLHEDSVAGRGEIPPGEVLRDDQGNVVGMLGYAPQHFRLGDRRLLGLGAHNFYVDPAVRMQGFFLFRRYLNHASADFCYSTSCNNNSAPLWAKCGAVQIPDSDAEDLLIRRTGPLIREIAVRKRVPQELATLLGLGGPIADLFRKRYRGTTTLGREPCSDWERLATIAEQCRSPEFLTPERTASSLQIQYSAWKGLDAGPAVSGVFRFWGPARHEGWFSIREELRGLGGKVRAANLHDVVWPRDSIGFAQDVLPLIDDVLKDRVDVFSIPGRLRLGVYPGLPGVYRRKLAAPQAFIHAHSRSQLPPVSQLSEKADFPPAYGA
jgi:hypothetical protein